MQLLKFHPYEKNTLKGFIDVKLSNGIILKGFAYHVNGKSSWVNPPSKKYADDNGKEQYDRIIDFESKDVYRNFSKQVVRLIEQEYDEEGKRICKS